MGKVGRVVSGLVALASFASVGVGCAASAGAPVAPLAPLAPAALDAPAHLTSTTLAVGIGDAAEAHGDDTKADEPAPLPTTCGAEATIKDARLCLPEATFAKKL